MLSILRQHGLRFALVSLYFIWVAGILRYPTSIDLTLVPLDPNFPLHALAGLDLSDGGNGFINTRLEFPDGAPIRYLAWPLLLCAQLFEHSFEPIAAFHLGILSWLTFQGILMYYLFLDIVQEHLRSLVGATLGLCAPQVLIALGNAQFENVAPAFLLLIAWSIERKKYGWLILGLLGTCFSSPYMGFLGLLLALILGFQSKWTWLSMGISALSAQLYYSAVTGGQIHESTQPAPSVMSESANLIGIFLPINIAENGGTELPSYLERIQLFSTAPSEAPFDDLWFWVMVTASSFLGVAWIVFGLMGLWQKRGDALTRKLALWGGVGLLCSFGDNIIIDIGLQQYYIPWIWRITDVIPGLADMNATHRFLMAPSLLLALGVACMDRRFLLTLGFGLCIFEALLISPAHWPIPAKKATVPDELSVIQKPFIFWPPPPVISSYKITMTSLLLNQPIALFSAQGTSMPDASGKISPFYTKKDRHGRSLQEWTYEAVKNDVTTLIQYRSFHESNGVLPIKSHQRMCYPSYCVSLLVQNTPTP